jgi:hypothetical protein
MIKYEYNTLVLDSSHNKHDQKAINDFVEQAVKIERERILNEIDKLEELSHSTRTPLFQDTIFERLRKVLGGTRQHPPRHFRDGSNGE